MAASSFSIWHKYDSTPFGTASILSYNKSGQRIRMNSFVSSADSSIASVTAGTKNVSVTHNFDAGAADLLGWNHYVFTQEDNGQAKLYVNGVLSSTVDNPYVNDVASNVGNVSTIGDTRPSRFDEFRSFKRVLNRREVEYLYDGGSLGGRSENFDGPAPIDIPSGIESASQVQSFAVSAPAVPESVQSSAEVSEFPLGLIQVLTVDSAESASQCSDTDVTANRFNTNPDPIIVGDRNTTRKERAVLEFDVVGVSINDPVFIDFLVENVVGNFLAIARRWTAAMPTTRQELEVNNYTTSGQVAFSPAVGSTSINVTQMVIDAKSAGETRLRVVLMEQPDGSNEYYEIDNSSDAPSIRFMPSTSADSDSVQSSSEAQDVTIGIKLDPVSLQSRTNVTETEAYPKLTPVDSAQSNSACQYVRLIKNTSVLVNSAQAKSQVQEINPGSFEFGLDGWVISHPSFIDSDWSRQEYPDPVAEDDLGRGVTEFSHDGDFSLRGKLRDDLRGVRTATLVYEAAGLTNFSFWYMLYGTFQRQAGITITVNGAEKLVASAWLTGGKQKNVWHQGSIELRAGTNTIVVTLNQHSQIDDRVYFDEVRFAATPAVLEVNSAQSRSTNSQVILGFNQALTLDDVQSSSQVSETLINVPATTDSSQSSSEASSVDLVRESQADSDSIQSSSEVEIFELTGDAVLLVDSVESASQARKFNLAVSPVDIQSFSQASNVRLGIGHAALVASAESQANAESVLASGTSHLSLADAQAQSEAERASVAVYRPFFVDSAQSQAQVSRFVPQTTTGINPNDVGLCTPTGDDEDVVTAIAGQDIVRGEVVRVDNSDTAYLASNLTQAESLYAGFAVTDATAGQPVMIATAGTLIVGASLRPNQIYCLSSRPGKIKVVGEVTSGEYVSIVGIAIASDRILIGNDITSVLLTAQTNESVTGQTVIPVPDEVKIVDDVPSAGRFNAPNIIDAGDAISRSGSLADNATVESSGFLGFAATSADEGCSIAYAASGATVDLGGDVMVANNVYVLARVSGRICLPTELDEGDYATVVGFATSSRFIRTGQVENGTLA